MPYATIVVGPHLLYTGSNGKQTAGIKVRATCSEQESKRRGKQHEWCINYFSLKQNKHPEEDFGCPPNEFAVMLEECKKIESLYRLKNGAIGHKDEWFTGLSKEDKSRHLWEFD